MRRRLCTGFLALGFVVGCGGGSVDAGNFADSDAGDSGNAGDGSLATSDGATSVDGSANRDAASGTDAGDGSTTTDAGIDAAQVDSGTDAGHDSGSYVDSGIGDDASTTDSSAGDSGSDAGTGGDGTVGDSGSGNDSGTGGDATVGDSGSGSDSGTGTGDAGGTDGGDTSDASGDAAADAPFEAAAPCAAGSVRGSTGCERCAFGQYCAGGDDAAVTCANAWDHDFDPATPCRAWRTCGTGYTEGATGTSTSDRECLSPEWTRSFAPTGGYAYTSGVAVGDDGTVVSVGKTNGALDGETFLGDEDAFVVAYDGLGNRKWTREFGTTSIDNASAVALDADGRIFVVGSVPMALPGQTSSGGFADVFIRAYDPQGAELWTRQFGHVNGTDISGVAVDRKGHVYVIGSVAGALPNQTTSGENDAYVRKYDVDGTEVWTRQFGASQAYTYAYGVAVNRDGDVVVVGGLDRSLLVSGGAATSTAYVRKFDATGNVLFTREFDTNRTYIEARSVALGTDGTLFVAGDTRGTLPTKTNAGLVDGFVRVFDSSGTEAWTDQYGTDREEATGGIAVDADGVVLVSGTTAGGTFPGQTLIGMNDAYVRTLSSTGAHVTTSQYGTAADDGSKDVALPSRHRVVLVGETGGGMDGEQRVGNYDSYIRMRSR